MHNVLSTAPSRVGVAVRVLSAAVPGAAFSGAFATAPLPTTLSVAGPTGRAHAALSAGNVADDHCQLAARVGGPGTVKYPLDAGD